MAWWCQSTTGSLSSLLQVKASKPLPEPMATYRQLDPREHISVKFLFKIKTFSLGMRWKMSSVQYEPFFSVLGVIKDGVVWRKHCITINDRGWPHPGHQHIQVKHSGNMVTLLHRNVFRFIGPLWGEFTCHRWIPLTKWFVCCKLEPFVERIVELSVIWDVLPHIYVTSL